MFGSERNLEKPLALSPVCSLLMGSKNKYLAVRQGLINKTHCAAYKSRNHIFAPDSFPGGVAAEVRSACSGKGMIRCMFASLQG